jgi:phosphoribosylaminoimidazole carboxylase
MVARGRSGEVAACPVAETLHIDSILLAAEAPARVPARLRERARAVAERAVACLDGAPAPGVARGVSGRSRN